MSPFLLIFGSAAAIAIAFIGISLLFVRMLRRRPSKPNAIRVKPLGILLCITQFLVAFVVIGWGRFHPESILGHIVATDVGAIAIIVSASVVGCVVSALLQRGGIVLYYRLQSGG